MQYAIERQLTIAIENQPGRLHSGVLPEVVVVCANPDCMTENKSA